MSRLNELTAREMSIAERKAGLSLATLEDPNFPKADLLIALGWVHAKRSEPTLSFEAYGDANTLNDIVEYLGIADDEEGND